MKEMFAQNPAFPYDPSVGTYSVCHPVYPIPLEYEGWQDENMSWKETCAIFAGLYPVNPVCRLTGPDVVKLLSQYTVSSYDKFPAGRLKHTVVCDDLGRVLTHGLIVRLGEHEFIAYTLTPWLNFAATKDKYDVKFEDMTFTEFNFQCTGPRILEVLERATGECLHDIPFMGQRTSSIDGKQVRLYRMGMAGTLGYEVHGNIDDARTLYTKITEVGREFGIQRMGWKSYSAQLCEGGYPQETFSFYGAGKEDPGFFEFLASLGFRPDIWPGSPILCGSAGPDPKKRYRNPLELGWHRSVSFAHEFRGKPALEKEAAKPTRKIVTLLWNNDDVMDVFGSLFRKGEEPYRQMDFPIDNVWRTFRASVRQQQEDVLKDGKLVGCSNARAYSLLSRDMFSTGIVNVDVAEPGTELTIVWGEPDERQKHIRATVAPHPRLALAKNAELDVSTVPCIRG
jgi:glycine cleavage system aminomethyltransferase T